jgi:hypothetical protein
VYNALVEAGLRSLQKSITKQSVILPEEDRSPPKKLKLAPRSVERLRRLSRDSWLSIREKART